MFEASVMGLRSSYHFPVQRVHHDVEPELAVFGVLQHVHQVRPGGHVRVGEPLFDQLRQLLRRVDLLHAGFDEGVRDTGVATASLAASTCMEPK